MFLESKMVETRNLMFEQAQEILKPLIFKCANVWLAEKEKGSDSHSKQIKLARALRKEFIGKNGGLPDLPGTASNPKRHWPIFLDSIEKEDNTVSHFLLIIRQ
jgi:hypothetical protein